MEKTSGTNGNRGDESQRDDKGAQGEKAPRKELDLELDLLEEKINDLRLQYEQYFLDIVTQPPDKGYQEVVLFIRRLQNAPFKNSASNFRMKALTHRFQTFDTYWKRVMKERSEGRYRRDLFKAKIRQGSSAE